ncbi:MULTISPECIES: type II toxin-antitoxin system RelB/DinJ family antitoxin [unclassified Adlercreutzia]|uniref:type II toxin-antitoxin system RelB/DinJ family antitoxin n=1 Tax=unclassified Adlercreutzia TaxID=2636013 RepID=UPI0013EA2721|nr:MULTISPECIES: type II toxin-antitoxin system RelB/DinJ family antitoxin [unclassified Adlercreutzia]
MALIQVTVDDEIKRKADAAFARNGITTPMAMRMMVTQVANENRTPFDNVFFSPTSVALAEDVRRDMLYAEAQELGLIPDDAVSVCDSYCIPDDVLEDLGLSAFEVGQ